jgi:hypothetical protein
MADRWKRDPRSVADAVPLDAYIVALVQAESEGEEGAAAAAAVATAIARQREHTLLVSGIHNESFLDELLGGSDGEGLPGALCGRARLTDVAVQLADRPFVYLPAGRDPSELSALLVEDSFISFAERVRQRGGTLLLLLPEGRLSEPVIRELLDGYVALGETVASDAYELTMFGRLRLAGAAGPGAAAVDQVVAENVSDSADVAPAAGDADLAPQLPEPAGSFALVEKESDPPAGMEPGSDASDAGVDPTSASWRRHRTPGGFPTRRVAAGAAAVAVLAVGWWWLAGAVGSPAGGEGDSTMSSPASSSPAGEVAVEHATPIIPPADAAAAAEEAPELPYSVLVASYAARSDAEDRLAQLRQSEGGPYFVVPTVVRGALYHRVFAGARPDVESARAMMTELVESGRKDDASAWHLRPARLAYLLGVFGRPSEADARLEEAVGAGLPAYVLAAPVDEGLGVDSVFQVYVGAYESPVAARAMISLLESAGEDPALVTRRGRRP